ncbi:hypothetical protein SAMN05444161_5580 [Rhizobiales bacterium GAS191]|jgi:hypothetical protein|nr:hypothetical protein SAMN05519103_04790 [Rhizobiales bacterium GAS113]SEE19734.1 hypothetical protein SAMN05519104_5463 [Rhizobiales bacterium GAS188]SEE37701.1 hypothetical protein SAMN05444161_5580 [Rhizobiales bacterium GAS191]
MRGTKAMKSAEAHPVRTEIGGQHEDAAGEVVVNGDASDRASQLPVRAEPSMDQNLEQVREILFGQQKREHSERVERLEKLVEEVRRELLRELQDVRDEMKAMYDDGERSRNRQAEQYERKRVELIKFVATTFNDMGQRIGTLVGGSEAS